MAMSVDKSPESRADIAIVDVRFGLLVYWVIVLGPKSLKLKLMQVGGGVKFRGSWRIWRNDLERTGIWSEGGDGGDPMVIKNAGLGRVGTRPRTATSRRRRTSE